MNKPMFANDKPDALKVQLRQLLQSRSGSFPSLADAAEALGISTRTLRRHLHQLDTSFQLELDQVRQELAIDYLAASDKSITEIALYLGFCDSSAFSKAFKRWTELSPRQFKKQWLRKDL